MAINNTQQPTKLNVNTIDNFSERKNKDRKISILTRERMSHVDVGFFSLVVMISFACKLNGFRQSIKLSWYSVAAVLLELAYILLIFFL